MVEMRLHMLIAEKRITQKELSDITGIRQPTISAYCNETYKHIVKEHIDIFCKYFECELTDLIVYKKDQ